MSRRAGTEAPIAHLRGRRRRVDLARLTRAGSFPWRAAPTPRGVEPDPTKPGSGVDYDTDWSRRLPARLARYGLTNIVWRPAVGYYARPTIRGTDRLDGVDGPVIFAANHASHADTPLLLTSIPEPWRNRLAVAAAADYFFGNRVTSTLSALGIGAIPIERTRVSKASMALPVRLLQNRWSVVIYPEGGRSPDGWGSGFRPGVALISKLADVPVVPVYISGTAKVLARGRTWPSRHRSVVVFGQPLTWTDEDDNRSFTDRIEGSVRGLADEAVTDWWTARRRFHAGASPDLSGPSTAGWRRRWALAPSHGPRRERWPRL